MKAVFFQDLSRKFFQDDILVGLLAFLDVIIISHHAFLTEEALKNIAITTLQSIDEFRRTGRVATEKLVSPECCLSQVGDEGARGQKYRFSCFRDLPLGSLLSNFFEKREPILWHPEFSIFIVLLSVGTAVSGSLWIHLVKKTMLYRKRFQWL